MTRYRDAMDRYALHEGVAAAFRLVDATNEFIADNGAVGARQGRRQRPARLTRCCSTPPKRCASPPCCCCRSCRASAPRSCAASASRRPPTLSPRPDAALADGRTRTLDQGRRMWPRRRRRRGAAAGRSAPQTVRLDGDRRVQLRTDRRRRPRPRRPLQPPPGASARRAPPRRPAPTNRIAIDDFMKVDLRVAKVLAAERVPKSKKLVQADGRRRHEQRTLVAGIAEALRARGARRPDGRRSSPT